jgi:hypothetical protein
VNPSSGAGLLEHISPVPEAIDVGAEAQGERTGDSNPRLFRSYFVRLAPERYLPVRLTLSRELSLTEPKMEDYLR